MISVQHVLARAQAATGQAILYWVGSGGVDPRAALPSTRLAVGRIWPTLDEAKRHELEPLAQAMGIDVHDHDLVLDACDCSGYVCWALGLARQAADGQWINTDSIWADATGPQALFQRLDRARPGALLVYPQAGSHENFGHVAIVVDADPLGRAVRIAHCSADNNRVAPFDSIKITSPEKFDSQPRSVFAWCREVE